MPSHTHIPLAYRILLLYFEPLAALNGALLTHFIPVTYLLGMSPSALPSTYDPSTQIIFDQLAATYMLFAWNEAIVLRCTSDIRVWKAVVLGIVLCDIVHLYGTWAALGGVGGTFWTPAGWRVEDWVNLGMLYGPGAMRVAFLWGLGLGEKDVSLWSGKRTGRGKGKEL